MADPGNHVRHQLTGFPRIVYTTDDCREGDEALPQGSHSAFVLIINEKIIQEVASIRSTELKMAFVTA